MIVLLLLGNIGISVATEKIRDAGRPTDADVARVVAEFIASTQSESESTNGTSGGACVGSDFADSFTDEDGNATDYAGYVAACLRLEADTARYGDVGYHLRRGIGIEPEQMRFEVNEDDSEDVIYAHAYSSRTCTGDDPLASIRRANVCYSAGGGKSVKLIKKLPPNCLIQICLNTLDCTGECRAYIGSRSELDCYEGMSYGSIKLLCASLEPPKPVRNETREDRTVESRGEEQSKSYYVDA
jgi:hypothetical protein